jgi:hypothetical protein
MKAGIVRTAHKPRAALPAPMGVGVLKAKPASTVGAGGIRIAFYLS